jgi:hypothetical protein
MGESCGHTRVVLPSLNPGAKGASYSVSGNGIGDTGDVWTWVEQRLGSNTLVLGFSL